MKVGNLYRFDRISAHTHHLNGRLALYLGEAFIHREDGVTVKNHKVLLHGDTKATIIDQRMLRWMEKVN